MISFPIAKINLGLNVVERRADGYHNLETVFFPVPIKDALEVQVMDSRFPSEFDCDLKVTNLSIEGDEQKNLVVKAYRLLKNDYPQLPRIHAHLFKQIPTQAGMGGGSSDGASMLLLLNEMFELNLSTDKLIGYASRLGADCAFFVLGFPAYAEGIGEKLTPVSLNLGGLYLAIVRPDIPVPTKEAFSLLTPQRPQKNCRTIIEQSIDTWRDELTNDFEKSVFALHPQIGEVKKTLYEMGAVYAAMSGSGSALFGLFRKPVDLDATFQGMFTYLVAL